MLPRRAPKPPGISKAGDISPFRLAEFINPFGYKSIFNRASLYMDRVSFDQLM